MIRLCVILGLLIAALGGALYVQHLRASNATLKTRVTALEVERSTLAKKIATDAAILVADNARADKAEADLKTFKEKADAQIEGLQSPDRLCFDGDDTKRLQRIFER